MNDNLFYLLVSLTAICAPVISTIIQSNYSLKKTKMHTAYNCKAPVYKEFAELYGMFYKHTTKETRQAFVSAAWSAALISDASSRNQILTILKAFEDSNDTTNQAMDEQFLKCIGLLNDDLQNTFK